MPNIFGQQLLELFRELSDILTQILLNKGRYIYSLVCLFRLRCFFIHGSCFILGMGDQKFLGVVILET